ncbi:AsmA family protein [Atlantibacter subterranea]|uniref:AsmA family protein n=1 Tax=Atlantibacter subterraneus TaxID=255519 RepID=A0A427UQC4_9ENTR|nr:AsmA family protein [Atlantibacter subterranea]RSB60090.1 AsmA family protein [Atlantibacter subterranea]RSE02069.1 AsmA family protein [Atlantibacter subterranea]RSE22720.1 AsmA family protein [Atlantibacter subterranea]
MKFIGKLIVALLVAVLVAILGLYILLQTRWGAGWITDWVNAHSDYHITFDEMDHRFSSPSHVLLKNVTFGRNGQPATLVAQSVDIGLSSRQITDPFHVDAIILREGTLNISPDTASIPFQADRLQLSDMAFNSPNSAWNLSAQRVNGGLTPWLPEAGRILGSKARIELSAGSLTLNGIPASNVLIQGDIDNDQVNFTTLGADVARGSLTGNARRNADGGWQVDNLRLSDIRLQSDKSLVDLLRPVTSLPLLKLGRVDVTDARLQGPNWAVTDLDMTLRDITFSNNDWQSEEGKLSLNASEFIYGSLHFFDPIANANLSGKGVEISQLTSRWEGGMIRTRGEWTRSDKGLTLADVAIAGLEYTLPEDWKKQWMTPLPEWLNRVTVTKFSASRNLIIDIDPTFPFQLTALDGYGNLLQLARNRQWGIWSGNATLNAAAATFNRVDVRRPSIALSANSNNITISELSAFAGKGMLEATASITQQPERQIALSLNGRAVPANVLENWGWPQVPVQGDANMRLSARGQLSADRPLKPTVNATLTMTVANGQQIQQTMQAGVVSGAPAPSPTPEAPAATEQPQANPFQ